jgi:hypothetical protein
MLAAEPDGVHAQVSVPPSDALRSLKLRVRLPGGRTRTLDLSGRHGQLTRLVPYARS